MKLAWGCGSDIMHIMRFVSSLVVLGLAGCAGLGMVDDGTSLSWGGTSGGRLVNPAELPEHGDGYQVPPTWASRGLSYGTDELVGLIVRAARRVQRDAPGSTLFVGDLS